MTLRIYHIGQPWMKMKVTRKIRNFHDDWMQRSLLGDWPCKNGVVIRRLGRWWWWKQWAPFEKSVIFCETTRCNIPEGSNLHFKFTFFLRKVRARVTWLHTNHVIKCLRVLCSKWTGCSEFLNRTTTDFPQLVTLFFMNLVSTRLRSSTRDFNRYAAGAFT
jgi:hypothetical protein